MKPALTVLLACVLLSWCVAPVMAQMEVAIKDASASYRYGEQVEFSAQVESSMPITEAYLFVQPQGATAWVGQIEYQDGVLRYTYALAERPFQPFARIEYWFRLTLENGEIYTSDAYWFYYDDNRFPWDSLEDGQFQVYWYDRDLAFGQDALNAARSGLEQAQAVLPVEQPPAPLRIFVYASTEDFQQAMQINAQSWMAGHASPELDTVLVSIAPGPDDRLELERQVPHELAHILQYHLAGEAYTRIPTWLMEGSASLAELFPNPDYGSALDAAVQSDTLIPMRQLCGAFPREASGAFLAYAQSTSFTRFLHQQYGTSGLTDLFEKYQDGMGCEEATKAVFGATLSELEYRWRLEVLGVDVPRLVLRNLAPYLAILALVIGVPLLGALLVARRKPA